MRVNRWASLLALLGVLLHAGLVVRHNGAVLAAELLHGHAIPLGAICYVFPDHPDGTVDPASDADAHKSAPKCPLCTGAAPDVALAGADAPAIYVTYFYAHDVAASAVVATPQLFAALPPSRAPPLAA
jgi:hypothetical protein